MVDDPHSSLATTDTTMTEAFGPFEADAFGPFHSSVTATIEATDDLIETEVVVVDGLDTVIVAETVADVPDGGVGTLTEPRDSLGWIAPTDADLLLEAEEEPDPVDRIGAQSLLASIAHGCRAGWRRAASR